MPALNFRSGIIIATPKRIMRTPEKYLLFIFDTPDNLEKYSLLEREAKLIPNYTLIKLDVNSTQAFFKKIAYRCQEAALAGGLCALTDEYGGLIVRIRPPVSFFDLREKLHSLGYRRAADDIHWKTA